VNIHANPARAIAQALLAASHLPTDDLAELDFRHFFLAGTNEAPIGLVGLQIDAPHALLRSLVVTSAERGAGVGSLLVAHAERYARSRGVTSIYLLTTTAERFFRHRGYARAARDEAPASIRSTREFTDICPASSAFMHKRLRD
jgi:amino-acid N-acetyltransferase